SDTNDGALFLPLTPITLADPSSISKLQLGGQMQPFACLYPSLEALFLALMQGTIPPTDTNHVA
ncbi:unnamed protein product, partial [Staurois parvus]